MSQHQLAHILPRHTYDLSNVGQPNQIRRDFDQFGRRDSAMDVGLGAKHRAERN